VTDRITRRDGLRGSHVGGSSFDLSGAVFTERYDLIVLAHRAVAELTA
jgi:hypothetical protein